MSYTPNQTHSPNSVPPENISDQTSFPSPDLTPPPISSPNRLHPSPRPFLIAAAILFVAVASALIFPQLKLSPALPTPSPSPAVPIPLPSQAVPADWKNYVSPVSGTSLQIPPTWHVITDETTHITVSNTKPDPDLANGATPNVNQFLLRLTLTSATAENYSPHRQISISTEGVPVISHDRYINLERNLTITSVYRDISPIHAFEKNILDFLTYNSFVDPNIPNSNIYGHFLPEGLELAQLHYHLPQEIANTDFHIFVKGNMNFAVNSSIQRSGVLYADKKNSDWQIFFEVKDLTSSRNNPILFWQENGTYYSVIVDTHGAGSGEGLGKLVTIDPQNKTWRTLSCFYYNPDSFNQITKKDPSGTLLSTKIKSYKDPATAAYNPDYIYNPTTKQFTFRNQVEPNCTSFDLDITPPITPSVSVNPISTCKTGGCSNELCLDPSSADVASICIWKDEYACLKHSVCEVQSNGQCGWTQTPAYTSCLDNLQSD